MRKAFAVWLHVPSLFNFFSTSFLTPRVLTCSLRVGGGYTVGFEEVRPILLNAIDVLLYYTSSIIVS
jgi:hypothetical protein